MAKIMISAVIDVTVSTLDLATLQTIITWVQTNIKDKLPATATLQVTYNIVP